MPGFYDYYDVAVVGAGHAGIEAALASARMGLKTVLITQTPDAIARMSCNPSIGGIAKGNIVREIDALGGEMAKLIDRSMIQFRMLNKSRGPAVQAPRSQADKITYSMLARKVCEQTPDLYTLMDTVIDILTTSSSTPLPPDSDSAAEKGSIPGEKRGYSNSNVSLNEYASEAARSGMRQKVTGVVTERGRIIPVRSVVLTTGTFLGGRIFIMVLFCSVQLYSVPLFPIHVIGASLLVYFVKYGLLLSSMLIWFFFCEFIIFKFLIFTLSPVILKNDALFLLFIVWLFPFIVILFLCIVIPSM